MKKDIIFSLYQLPQTVFSLKELSLLFPGLSYVNLKRRLGYYTQTGKLKNLTKGIYTKIHYNELELATKIYIPSYISLETVLQKAGMVFQYYETIFVISYVIRTVEIDSHTFQLRRLKESILLDSSGIINKELYWEASVERAFLDVVYLYKDYHIDNLGPLDWKKVMQLKSIYHSKAFEKRVDDYYSSFKEDYAGPSKT